MLYRPKALGGLGLSHLELRQCSLLINWVVKACTNSFLNSYATEWIFPSLGDFVWSCNISSLDAQKVIQNQTFWKTVMVTWAKFHFYNPSTCEEIQEQIIWYNSHIRIDGTVITANMHMIQHGIFRVKHILDASGNIMSHATIEEEAGTSIPWLWYYQLREAIPRQWKQMLAIPVEDSMTSSTTSDITDRTLSIENLIDVVKVPRTVYKSILIQDISNAFCEQYGTRFYKQIDVEIWDENDYYALFRNLYKLTSITMFRNFQYRLLLGKVYTNSTLYKWKIIDNDKCEICNLGYIQTPCHLFWECKEVRSLWSFMSNVLNVNLTLENIFTNMPASPIKNPQNTLILYAKKYIFNAKCKGDKITTHGLIRFLKYWLKIEKYNAHTTADKIKWENLLAIQWF